ncbi:MAG: hypothetical protein ACI8Z9_002102 [Paraglaciecola sp.]|jgi:hypothetical protein
MKKRADIQLFFCIACCDLTDVFKQEFVDYDAIDHALSHFYALTTLTAHAQGFTQLTHVTYTIIANSLFNGSVGDAVAKANIHNNSQLIT